MLDKRVNPYNALIDNFYKQGKLDEARKLLNEMINKNTCPDVVTLSARIDGFCKEGK